MSFFVWLILLSIIFSKSTHVAVNGRTVSPIYTNLQVANFQRCKCAFHQHQAWVKLQLVLRLLLLTILQLYHLPPPFPPPVSNSSFLFTRCQPLYASCCTVLLYFSRYCIVRLKMFSLFFVFVFLCIICVKSTINLLQYYIADCVSWVPRLTLLNLQTNRTYEYALRTELVCI